MYLLSKAFPVAVELETPYKLSQVRCQAISTAHIPLMMNP